MLPKHISTSKNYEDFLDAEFNNLPASVRERLLHDEELKHMRRQMISFRPEFAQEIIASCYSKTGRRGMDPVIIIRSLLLMLAYGCLSITKWVRKVKADIALQFLIGFWKIPSIGSHYDLINRILGIEPHMDDLYSKGKKPRPGKKTTKSSAKGRKKRRKNNKRNNYYENGEKVNYDEHKTRDLAQKYSKNPNCDRNRLTRKLEQIFDLLVVRPSCEYFSILEEEDLTLSGDGTALPAHSCPYGHKVKKPVDEQHSYRYTAPDADWGKDSYKRMWYYGYALYTICYHKRGLDLPLFLEKHPASRHDALPMITATAHMLDVNPSLKPRNMALDAAGDGGPNHEFLITLGMRPIIKRNGRFKTPDKVDLPKAKTAPDGTKEHFNKDGVPVCMANCPMRRNGYDKKLKAYMYRCPRATGKLKTSCPHEAECNKTPYGRVLRVPDQTNVRLFGQIPYNSRYWRALYKNRTSCERINKRILKDYHLENVMCRSGDKLLFFAMLAGILIHLDAWIKIGR